jgi:glycosyltransferase involved in cell wall biosynthesis
LGHDVTVLAAEEHASDIQAAISSPGESLANVNFRLIPWRRISWQERLFPPAHLLNYSRWLKAAYRDAQQLHAERPFDLVHQCTYVGFRVPGRLWKLDIPFVWGPIGGLENTPWRFLPMLGLSGFVYFAVRNIINSLQKRFLPGPKRAFAKAGACGGIIAATAGIGREIKRCYGQESHVICEIGPPPVIAREQSLREPGEPLQLAWSGLHLPRKALPLLLRAAASLPPEVEWNLKILGRGPCTGKWKRLAEKLGIAQRCQWLGWLPREQAVREMNQAHVFVITSMQDLTSTVLLEALSQGLPVVCPDHCGFSNVVTPDCGIKLPLESPRQLQRDLADAILRLEQDETERRRLGTGALRRIHDFSWEGKAQALNAIYQRAVQSYAKRSVAGQMTQAVHA